MFRFFLPVGAALAMVAGQVQAAPAGMNQNSPYQNQQANEPSYGHQNSRYALSSDVDSMLNSTNQARRASEQQNKEQALADVNAALNSLQQAEQASSHQQFIPLYTELDEYSVMGPIMAARNGQNGSNMPSNHASNMMRNPNDTAVKTVAGEFTSVVVDTRIARTHLEAAKQALEKGDCKAADGALSAAQDSVIVSSVAADLPLLRVRENLVLARAAANSGDYQEADSALQSASRALRNYAAMNPAHAAAAQKLESQISSADRAAANHRDLTAEINKWWNETTDWIHAGNGSQGTVTAQNNAPGRQ